MTLSFSSDELKLDVDTAWFRRYGSTEPINGLKGRIARNELSDEEQAKAAGCATAEDIHAELYPDFVGQQEFREAFWAAQDEAAPAADPPEPVIDILPINPTPEE